MENKSEQGTPLLKYRLAFIIFYLFPSAVLTITTITITITPLPLYYSFKLLAKLSHFNTFNLIFSRNNCLYFLNQPIDVAL